MQNFKLLIAIMFAVVIVQLHAAQDFTPSTSSRTRTTSKECMELLKKQADDESSSSRFQLKEAIKFLQNSQIRPVMVHIPSGRDPKIQARYNELSCFAVMLGAVRSELEDRHVDLNASQICSKAQLVEESLQSYRRNEKKITTIVGSKQYRDLETRCQDIMALPHC